MIYILLMIIVGLLFYIFDQKRKLKKITKQVNQVLFHQNELYISHFKEGQLSVLENVIHKLVNRLYQSNQLLKQDQLILKQALEDISHQMKTPLTALNLIQERLKQAEGLEKRKLIKEQQHLFNKIEWLVYSLLKIAQLDSNTVIFLDENIHQKDLFQQLIQPFEIQIELKDIEIQFSCDDRIIQHIDIHWTLEALSNILKNCIEHIDNQGTIQIMMSENPLYHEIIIQDNGKGIAQEDLNHIFERFYKGKNATQQSVGIGLSLTHMIIEKQNGTIVVKNTYPGVQFIIHLYKENV